MIISDFYKQYCNIGNRPSLYFWRDAGGAHEVDCILDQGTKLYPIEMKAGKNIASDSFRGLDYWNKLSGCDPRDSYLIYANGEKQIRKKGNVIGWKDSSSLISSVLNK